MGRRLAGEEDWVLTQEGVYPVGPDEGARLVEIWESSVRATRDFLSESDIASLKPRVLPELLELDPLLGVRDEAGTLVGFVGVANGRVEALFVDPSWHRMGVGRRLVTYAVVEHGATAVDVNEQNAAAVAFYRRMRFEVEGRSEDDREGRPFPLLHMRRRDVAT